MTGPEHYRKAEELAKTAARWPESSDALALIGLAQVHATLALTAATAMSAPVDGAEEGMAGHEAHAWYQIAGVMPSSHDEMTTDEMFTGEELREMDRDTEYRLDAEDDARNAAAVEADETGGTR